MRVTAFQGERAAVEQRLRPSWRQGVPNYFGEQRFGRGAGNLVRGTEWLLAEKRHARKSLRGLWLSAVRSDLFNQVLAERVRRVLESNAGRRYFATGRQPGTVHGR